MASIHNTIIIGSGPAGYTASIYLARALLNPVQICGILQGGELMNTTEVENFPSYPDGIQGPELIYRMQRQTEKFGTTLIYENVINIDTSTFPFTVTTHNNNTYKTKSVIIATGSEAKWLGLKNEEKIKGDGLSTCATCDAYFYMNKNVLCIGGGDSAMEEAIFLSKYCKSVTVINRSNKYRASKIILQKAQNIPNISFVSNTIVKEWIINENGLSGVLVKNVVNDNEECIKCDGVFLAIGHTPNTKFLNDSIKLDKDGYILTTLNTMTSVDGIFVCGDVSSLEKNYKQAITASGSGCKAALDCEKWLELNNSN